MIVTVFGRSSVQNETTLKYLRAWEKLDTVCFSDVGKCIDFLSENAVDIIIISIDETEGIPEDLIDYIRKRKPQIVTCLIGSDESQAKEMYRNRCDSFILRQHEQRDLEEQMDDLILLTQRIKPVRIVTFGCFDIFYNGKRINFRNRKAKELLALCIDRRGQKVSIPEAADRLWADHPYDEKVKVMYRKAVMELRSRFREIGLENFFSAGRGYCFIDPAMANCDYYNFLEDPMNCMILYNGTYMYEYSWAEETLAALEALYHRVCGKTMMV